MNDWYFDIAGLFQQYWEKAPDQNWEIIINLTSKLGEIDLYPYDVIYVNKHSVQCIVGLFGGDAPPLLLTIEAFTINA